MVVRNDNDTDGISDLDNLGSLNDGVPRYDDLQVTCCDCGKVFIFTAGEQTYYRDKDLAPPKRCLRCRKWKRFRYEHQKLNNDDGDTK